MLKTEECQKDIVKSQSHCEMENFAQIQTDVELINDVFGGRVSHEIQFFL